jgi:acetyl esterase/lipase
MLNAGNTSRSLGYYSIPADKQHPIVEVEFTALRGPHGTIPIRVLYWKSGEDKRKRGQAGALIYFHGGRYTVGSVDEFENGLRLVAEESGVQVIIFSSPFIIL